MPISAGVEVRELLVYGPRAGIRLLPVGFGADSREIIMEAYAEGSESLSPYRRRSGLFAFTLAENGLVTRALPGEQACFCAVGFRGDLMLRLRPNRALNGLDVEIVHLDSGERRIIPALSPGKYSEGGAILISADGRRAVYALSQLDDKAPGAVQSALALVDIENGRQRIASGPIPDLLRPLGFTDENRAALITTRRNDVTWKIDLEDGRLLEIADAVYLGVIADR